jgi:periplasmic protein TonB
VSTQNLPPPPAPIVKPVDRARNYLVWGFAISIIIHLIGAPIVSQLRYHETQQPDETKVSISKKVKVVIPTPPPTPPPTPTPPPPKQTPPPQKSTPPPQPKPLKLNIPKTTSNTSANAPAAYVPPKTGSENGAPQAQGTAEAVAATAAPTAEPTKPSCSQPHVDPTTKNAVQPDYPEIAREQGASGTAEVKVTLDATGNVLSASIQQGTGSKVLDDSAIAAAKASTFSPEIDNCQPTGGTYLFRADFTSQ